MNWFTSKVQPTALRTRVDNKEVDAARRYLLLFMDNHPIDRDLVLKALTILLVDVSEKSSS